MEKNIRGDQSDIRDSRYPGRSAATIQTVRRVTHWQIVWSSSRVHVRLNHTGGYATRWQRRSHRSSVSAAQLPTEKFVPHKVSETKNAAELLRESKTSCQFAAFLCTDASQLPIKRGQSKLCKPTKNPKPSERQTAVCLK